MDSFVCFMWNNGTRDYRPEHVNALARGINKHYPDPHRFICITSEYEGFSEDVEVMPTPEAAQRVIGYPSPEGKGFPSSYRRLWAFSEEARCLGDRIMMLDVDCIITGDLRPLFAYEDDFVGWRPKSVWGKSKRLAGGTWMLRTGTHTEVWDNLTPESIAKARAAGWRGSDQAWISHCLSDTCRVWPQDIGIYQRQDGVAKWLTPPSNAKIIHFNGNQKYWQMPSKHWAQQTVEAYAIQ